MHNSTAYFAGVATVFTATALGFGGALFLTSSTAPRSPAEPTKLERSVAAPAQAVPSPDGRSVGTGNAGTTQGLSQTSPLPGGAPQQSTQQSAASSPQEQTASTAQTPKQAPPQPAATDANQSRQSPAASAPQSPENAYARSTDEDIRKYVRRRDRRWAHRHYRDEDAIAAKASEPVEQSVSQSSTPGSSAQSESPQANQPPAKSADQSLAKANDADTVRSKRRHDRRWARGYMRSDDSLRGDSRGQSVDIHETPQDEAPPFIAPPRWRPFFSADDDD
jgi:hypothetical protein